VLLDQPLTNLDSGARAEARVQLRRLHRELGTTMICTTHDQSEAMALGDRVAVMSQGALEQVGTARGVYEYPANLFVAGFVGTPRMNLVPVVLEGRMARAATFAVELPRPLGVEPAVLGIRPEGLSEVVADGAPVVEVRAEMIEMVGAHQLVHGSAGPDRLIARVARSLVVFRGDVVRLAIDPRRLHVFDQRTGRALL
jgi:multiple sugar transport system ATP-binding protein